MIRKGTAHFISVILNPVFATFASLVIALQVTPTDQKLNWAILLAVLNLMIPIVVVAFLMQRGFALDDTLANSRVKRERIYAIAILFLIGLVQWYLSHRWQTGQPFIATVTATTLLTAAVGAISYQWKISHHLTNISALVLISALVVNLTTLWLALLIPISAWSRQTLERHTVRQMVGGTLLAPAVILPVFYLYGLL